MFVHVIYFDIAVFLFSLDQWRVIIFLRLNKALIQRGGNAISGRHLLKLFLPFIKIGPTIYEFIGGISPLLQLLFNFN